MWPNSPPPLFAPQNVSVPSSDRGALRVQYAKNPFGKKRDISGQLIDTLPRDMQVCVCGGGRGCMGRMQAGQVEASWWNYSHDVSMCILLL